MNKLEIRIVERVAGYPTVRLLIDGRDPLTVGGHDEGNSPAALLDSGALLPMDPPRRVAFYGCGCGEFGCANVAGLVTREGDQVVWSDFLSITGAYGAALPDEGDDPALDPDDLVPRRHRLPTFRFDAEEYLATVRAATEDPWSVRR